MGNSTSNPLSDLEAQMGNEPLIKRKSTLDPPPDLEAQMNSLARFLNLWKLQELAKLFRKHKYITIAITVLLVTLITVLYTPVGEVRRRLTTRTRYYECVDRAGVAYRKSENL